MAAAPKNIRALQDDQKLEVHWHDGAVHRIPYRFLRGRCPCAACVDENTGVRVVDVDAIPETIQLTNVAFSGNYALKISWNDTHDTGLFTWEYLSELCQSDPVERVGCDASELP